jgi:hypothetical protein
VSIAVVQTLGIASTSAVTSQALSISTTAGNTLVASIGLHPTSGTPTVSSVTDSARNTWTKAAGTSLTSGQDAELWVAYGAAAVSSVTVTASGTTALTFNLTEISGLASSGLDLVGLSSSSTTSSSVTVTASGTTASANEIAIAATYLQGHQSETVTSAGYIVDAQTIGTVGGDNDTVATAHDIFTSTQTNSTFTASLSTANIWAAILATFRASGSAIAGTGSLAGSSQLSGTGQVLLHGTGTIATRGALSGAGELVLTGAGTFRTSGVMVGSGVIALSGTGRLTSASSSSGQGTVVIAGRGSLTSAWSARGAGLITGSAVPATLTTTESAAWTIGSTESSAFELESSESAAFTITSEES